MLAAGELVAVPTETVYGLGANALDPAAVDQVASLERARADRDTAQALLALAQQSAACNASHSVEARLSRWLLRARDLCGSETLPLTQEFLAQLIGVQRNAISIVAHAFQQAGIIQYSRGHIGITDVEGLRETSCECYDAVKAHHGRLLNGPIDELAG